jgi:hypothetical protein
MSPLARVPTALNRREKVKNLHYRKALGFTRLCLASLESLGFVGNPIGRGYIERKNYKVVNNLKINKISEVFLGPKNKVPLGL